jgi:hypothetical protein
VTTPHEAKVASFPAEPRLARLEGEATPSFEVLSGQRRGVTPRGRSSFSRQARGETMSIYELDISWATTTSERRLLRWELLAAIDVAGVFLTTRDDVLAVLWRADRRGFETLARSLGAASREEKR